MLFSFRWPLERGLALLLFLWPLILLPAAAQKALGGHSSTPISSLRLSRNSGYIFEGTVLSVDRVGESGGAASIQITFRVEQGIRGPSNGQVLAIREWAGLWNSGERYRTGERLLLFLYSPSKLGLTSPVGGPAGRFRVDSGGYVILDNFQLAAIFDQPSPSLPARAGRMTSRAFVRAIQGMATE